MIATVPEDLRGKEWPRRASPSIVYHRQPIAKSCQHTAVAVATTPGPRCAVDVPASPEGPIASGLSAPDGSNRSAYRHRRGRSPVSSRAHQPRRGSVVGRLARLAEPVRLGAAARRLPAARPEPAHGPRREGRRREVGFCRPRRPTGAATARRRSNTAIRRLAAGQAIGQSGQSVQSGQSGGNAAVVRLIATNLVFVRGGQGCAPSRH
ncbi:MAG: hypothetical protein QOJ74_297 [Ilumatobacteraceae bacterium]|nr:hypothetical protein [Ilumatobacteraceae bacterium]